MAASTPPSCGDSVARAVLSNLRVFLGVAGLVLALDQGTKQWVVTRLEVGDALPVIAGRFYLTHVTNPGAAFSLLADTPETFRAWFFPILGLVALLMVVSLYRQLAPGDALSAAALGGILGGACGNLSDRLLRGGEVVDFLHIRLWSGYAWPDFNFADSFIVTGIAVLLLTLMRGADAPRPTR